MNLISPLINFKNKLNEKLMFKIRISQKTKLNLFKFKETLIKARTKKQSL